MSPENASTDPPVPETAGPTAGKAGQTLALRLWPAWLVCFVMLTCMITTVSSSIDNRSRFMVMMAGPLVCCLLFILYVILFSRLRWKEILLLSLSAVIAPAVCVSLSVQESPLYTALWVYAVPLAIFTTTAGLSLFCDSPRRIRNTSRLLFVGWMLFTLVRVDGFDGSYYPEFAWRWTPVHEQTLAALPQQSEPVSTRETTEIPVSVPAEWPRFRGSAENGISTADLTPLDWKNQPPEILWKIRVGPAWSSFSCSGKRLFTQEQRHEQEYVSCYDAADGSLIWSHADNTRFEEVVSGAGPRSTPAVINGRVFAVGGRGLLTCLDEETGAEVWQRDFVMEFGADPPMWGFSGSPEPVDDKIVVYVGGEKHGLTAFDMESGEVRWSFPSRGMNYTTVKTAKLCETPCLLFCDGAGVHALDPATGQPCWTFKPTGYEQTPMVDPQQFENGDLLVALGDGAGVCRLQVTRTEGDEGLSWKITELWSSRFLRPSFNDSLISNDLVFGFNQAVFSCIDGQTGKRLWHGGRYGFGQAILLQTTGQIIVAAENGDAVLLRATGDGLQEQHRISVLNGKTWNHPIVANGCLYLRNGADAVCMKLTPASSSAPAVASVKPVR